MIRVKHWKYWLGLMVSFFLGLGFSLYYLNQTKLLQGIAGLRTPGSNPAHIYEISFLLKNWRDLHFDNICWAETKSLSQET